MSDYTPLQKYTNRICDFLLDRVFNDTVMTRWNDDKGQRTLQ